MGEKCMVAPVICLVIEPGQAKIYRKRWPSMLMLILPVNGRGPGFARWAIQKICTKVFLETERNTNDGVVKDYGLRQLPWIWMADDSLASFYRLDDIDFDGNSGIRKA